MVRSSDRTSQLRRLEGVNRPRLYHHLVTLRDDHDDLPAHAEVLLERLDRLGGQFGPSKVAQYQHMQHAERCRVLGDHLRGVLTLSSSRHYAAALVVARTALEHHLLDRLLFLATRWIERYGIKRPDAPAEEARLAALKTGSRPDIVKWWYESASGVMRVLIRGVFKEGSLGRGMTVSPYFFRVDRYDPFTVDKKLAPRLATGFSDRVSLGEWAAESLQEWYGHFTYERLRENLEINRLLRPRLGIQVDVHDRFLGAYVHGVQKAYENVYGYNYPSNVGGFNHCASELALLYIVTIAAAELEIFGQMAKRTPRLRLVGWDRVEDEIAAARASSSHLWFLSGEPHMYDRIREVDTRMPRPGSGLSKRPRPDPASLDPKTVRYYPQPLERLVRLHHSYQELLTGQVFLSPFDRPDIRN